MTANGIPRKLTRKVAWAVAMSTAAYVIEALWEGQRWLLNGFSKLTTAIGQAVAGTLSTAKGEGATRPGGIPPTEPALDRTSASLCGVLSREFLCPPPQPIVLPIEIWCKEPTLRSQGKSL